MRVYYYYYYYHYYYRVYAKVDELLVVVFVLAGCPTNFNRLFIIMQCCVVAGRITRAWEMHQVIK